MSLTNAAVLGQFSDGMAPSPDFKPGRNKDSGESRVLTETLQAALNSPVTAKPDLPRVDALIHGRSAYDGAGSAIYS
jgi:hypothetical protein